MKYEFGNEMRAKRLYTQMAMRCMQKLGHANAILMNKY